MSGITNSERLKKVMRIALVGVRPADQVMLKGYLRILLRLEADLEWVAANHEAVDLFMINSEFSSSESVQRLLATKPNSGVLYISRNETGDGHLVGNLLTIPLKELEELNQWLAKNVKSSTASSNAATTQAPAPTASVVNRPLEHPNHAEPTSVAAKPATPTINPMLDLINVIRQLQRRENNLFSLINNDGKVLAYIQPKQQRIWVQAADMTLSQSLRLMPATGFDSNPTQSVDLVQWLWQQALAQAPQLTGVLRPDIQYHITSWVKPAAGDARHNQLKIQAVLESRELTLAQIAGLSQSDHNHIKRTVIALVVAGVMPPSVYDALHTHFESLQTVQAAMLNDKPAEISQPIQGVSTAAESVTQTPMPSAAVAQAVNQSSGDDGMKGFLSRLRRKLGI